MAKEEPEKLSAVAETMWRRGMEQKPAADDAGQALHVTAGIVGPENTAIPEEHALWESLYSGPAPLATRIGMVPGIGFLRLAFAEQYNQFFAPQFRAAVTLPDYNAWELWKLLGQNSAVQYWEAQYQASQASSADTEQEADGADKSK